MAHIAQQEFCLKIKNLYPEHFKSKKVLDIGSLDINGNNRYLFEDCSYFGIDIGEGPNVDYVCKAHEHNLPDGFYDTVISTECFEHDMFYAQSIENAIRLTKSGGMFIFTCATTNRPEHGTRRTSPVDAPLLANYEDWQDYYKNLTEEDIRKVFSPEEVFETFAFEVNEVAMDLYFYGIKK